MGHFHKCIFRSPPPQLNSYLSEFHERGRQAIVRAGDGNLGDVRGQTHKWGTVHRVPSKGVSKLSI